MKTTLNERLLDDEQCNMVNQFDLRDGHFIFVAESNEWETEDATDKAALITFLNNIDRVLWIPKSAIGFSPSGAFFVKEWFYDKEIRL